MNYVAVDTTDPSSVEELAKAIQDEHGTVDVVINNAAAHDAGNYTPDVIKTVLDTNVRSTLRVSLASHIQEGFWTEATTDVSGIFTNIKPKGSNRKCIVNRLNVGQIQQADPGAIPGSETDLAGP